MRPSPSAQMGLVPVTQQVLGWPYGDCVRACYAAILGLPRERVPRFDPAVLDGEEQTDRERRWLRTLGLDLVEVAVSPEEELPKEVLDRAPPCEHLISGISPRGYGHRCVGWGGRVLWDPHPSQAGLQTVFGLGFLVPR